TEWIGLHKRFRSLVGSGTVVRGDHPDPALLVHGVVSPDREEAVFVAATVASSATQVPTPVHLPGLAPERRYLVRRVGPRESGPVVDLGSSPLAESGVTLPGRVLGEVGVRLPVLAPETAWVLHVREV
ncbi:MAG TPA: GH36 C-terminal domain-containing protein, partial [Nocardioidaceae bacterium]